MGDLLKIEGKIEFEVVEHLPERVVSEMPIQCVHRAEWIRIIKRANCLLVENHFISAIPSATHRQMLYACHNNDCILAIVLGADPSK